MIRILWQTVLHSFGRMRSMQEIKISCLTYTFFDGFYNALGENVETILHKIVCHERCFVLDPSGKFLKRMNYINSIFEEITNESDNISIFDVCNAPYYTPNERGNGLFVEDVVHYTSQVNNWVAEQVLESYK